VQKGSNDKLFAALHHGTAEPFGGSLNEPRQLNREAGTECLLRTPRKEFHVCMEP
jgi:hypothetical protein